MLKMWKQTNDAKYLDYVVNWADTLINDKGEIHKYKVETYNIDYINSGKVLFDVYQQTGDKKYKKAMDRLIKQLQYASANYGRSVLAQAYLSASTLVGWPLYGSSVYGAVCGHF